MFAESALVLSSCEFGRCSSSLGYFCCHPQDANRLVPDHEGVRLVDVGVVVAHDVVEAAVQEVRGVRDRTTHVLLVQSK